jgi:hypothetical protein
MTYTYSRYLMWGLAEVASTLLIFCVPAIPIAFHKSSPVRRLTSKAPTLSSQRSLASKARLNSWPRPSSEYRVMSDISDVQLAALESGKSPVRTGAREAEENPLFGYLGIIKTTEIEIKVQKDIDLRAVRRGQLERQHPWMVTQHTSHQRLI